MNSKRKFLLALCIAIIWLLLSLVLALPWINQVGECIGKIASWLIISGIALIPGFIGAFSLTLFFSKEKNKPPTLNKYPPLSILIAVYNEADHIKQTIISILAQKYPGRFEILLLNDGSTDDTVKVVQSLNCAKLKIIELLHAGKSHVLNKGLELARYSLVVTLDADTILYKDALKKIVEHIEYRNQAAVAGSIYVGNPHNSWCTAMQSWDYLNGIAVVKKAQSILKGTLVAQGAFSIYRTDVLKEVGGWPHTIGEDIVLSFSILKRNYEIGWAEDAIAFTTTPETYIKFFHQRSRWARGLIEAFKFHPGLLLKRKMSTFYVIMNLFFPWIDFIYTFIFIPGLIAAFFGFHLFAGTLTLLVLPLSLLSNLLIYNNQKKLLTKIGFIENALPINHYAFVLYWLGYNFIMAPACVAGYFKEFFLLKKNWGTK